MAKCSKNLAKKIRDQDYFGSTINFNFDGADSYKTLPGGFVSCFIFFCFISYSVLQAKAMFFKESWGLNQQTVVSTSEEL